MGNYVIAGVGNYVIENPSNLGNYVIADNQAGYTSMLRYAKAWPERIWAVEGANGAVDHWPSGSSRPARAFSMYRPSCCPGPALRHRAQPKDRRA